MICFIIFTIIILNPISVMRKCERGNADNAGQLSRPRTRGRCRASLGDLIWFGRVSYHVLSPVIVAPRPCCTPLLLYPAVVRYCCTPLLLYPVIAVPRYCCTPLLLYPVVAVPRYCCTPLLLYPVVVRVIDFGGM